MKEILPRRMGIHIEAMILTREVIPTEVVVVHTEVEERIVIGDLGGVQEVLEDNLFNNLDEIYVMS